MGLDQVAEVTVEHRDLVRERGEGRDRGGVDGARAAGVTTARSDPVAVDAQVAAVGPAGVDQRAHHARFPPHPAIGLETGQQHRHVGPCRGGEQHRHDGQPTDGDGARAEPVGRPTSSPRNGRGKRRRHGLDRRARPVTPVRESGASDDTAALHAPATPPLTVAPPSGTGIIASRRPPPTESPVSECAPTRPAAPRPRLVLYGRAECHLCVEMWAELEAARARHAADLSWVEVDDDPAIAERYGPRVPVLVLDEEEVCHYFLDEDMLRLFLTRWHEARR
ncbi:MAG: glutaredoxin family protein [Ectothiorhodospiraceae bacterium]|nr:glutaredoxin family protein [Ectothiorhodospiraceae bacterium]